MPSWPAALPQLFKPGGAGLSPISNAAPIDTESGEPLTRVRFTGEMDQWSGELQALTNQQANDLLNFWRYDLKNGTLRFTYDHPLTGESVEMLFIEPPRLIPVNSINGQYWQASLSLQTMP